MPYTPRPEQRGEANCRRLLIRWEHQVSTYRSFFACAIMRLCVARLAS